MGKIVNFRSSSEYNWPQEEIPEKNPTEIAHPLDGPLPKRRLAKLEEWMEVERLRQAPNRFQMAIDEDFYDNLQWSDEDAAILLERGQAPLVYNWVKSSVDWVTGTEKRTRIDFKILPRSSNDRNEAETKTKLLKYLSDVNNSPFHRSRSFEEAVKVGLGWLECGTRDDPTKEIVYDRHESWRNIVHDSFGRDRDAVDWRYIFRQKSIDVDVATMLVPERAGQLRSAATNADIGGIDGEDEFYLGELMSSQDRELQASAGRFVRADGSASLFNRRERVRIYEAWYRMPARLKFLIGGPLHGVQLDPSDDYHLWLLQRRSTQVIERLAMQMRVALFIRGTLLMDTPSPYRHNDFPFTPIWGNVRGRDNQPYGMIRVMRDPQEDFNKRMSKALHALSTRRVFMDRGAVEDIEEVREEAARPDSVFAVTPGMRFELDTDTDVAKSHLEFAQVDARMIQTSGGVTDENMGRETNARSGKAIEARQDQGSVVTTGYFDGLRFATKLHGQKFLSLSEQFITWERKIRVIGERWGYDFIEINKPGVDKTGQPVLLNDITASQADYIVSAQDFRESMRQAGFDQLMEMTGKLAQIDPMLALKLLDDVLEYADLPGAEAIIQTIREINGKPPRDKRPSEEEMAQMEAQKQREQAKKQLAEHLSLKSAALAVQEQAATVKETEAKAAKLMAEAQGAGLNDDVRRQYEEQLRKLQDDTKKLVDTLTDQVRTAKIASENRHAEIERKYATEMEKAHADNASKEAIETIRQDHEDERHRLEQETAENVAAISKSAERDNDALTGQFDALKTMIEDVKKRADEAKQAADDAEKQAKEAAKDAEKRVKDVEAELRESEKRAREDAAKAVEQIQKQVDQQGDKEEKAEPTVIVVPAGGDGDEVREIDVKVETDADGRITGYKGKRTTKRTGKSAKPAKDGKGK